ncbi:G5 domain-containing protein [Kribbella sp. NBC_01484]|uniref:G5 domain-containing protein n=1 Tax=Kribbella sp. NBC_01484 TaxID=2903579 RepID=UPI002E2EC917|nr:G5 domain-containing protein [Kribbella sp. NBC_01484]
MHLIRAALAPIALLAVGALATGCGSSSGTSGTGEPAAIASIRTAATPTSTQASTTAPPTTEPTTTAEPTTKAKPTATTPARVTTRRQVVEFKTIPFKKKTVTDGSLPKGEKTIRTTGSDGTRKLTYEVTYVNGVQTAKELLRQEVSKQPRTQVTVVGTKVEEESGSSGCDPNYSGCVPIASDVDCSGGSGNGPAYVQGPVTVIGDDIYGLDRDGDGIGCED